MSDVDVCSRVRCGQL